MTKKGTQTCFRLIGDKLDTYRVINNPLDDKLRAWVHKQYPGQEITFLNDRLKVVAPKPAKPADKPAKASPRVKAKKA